MNMRLRSLWMNEVWQEVAGNFIHVGKIAKSVNESYCTSGDQTEGIGASRYCSINFQGKEIQIKERIVEIKED